MGIPRLKFPSDAPSRSTLKLEEAFHMFIPYDEWEERLEGGLQAVDLGHARRLDVSAGETQYACSGRG